jgi:hypothetical protein
MLLFSFQFARENQKKKKKKKSQFSVFSGKGSIWKGTPQGSQDRGED